MTPVHHTQDPHAGESPSAIRVARDPQGIHRHSFRLRIEAARHASQPFAAHPYFATRMAYSCELNSTYSCERSLVYTW